MGLPEGNSYRRHSMDILDVSVRGIHVSRILGCPFQSSWMVWDMGRRCEKRRWSALGTPAEKHARRGGGTMQREHPNLARLQNTKEH